MVRALAAEHARASPRAVAASSATTSATCPAFAARRGPPRPDGHAARRGPGRGRRRREPAPRWPTRADLTVHGATGAVELLRALADAAAGSRGAAVRP